MKFTLINNGKYLYFRSMFGGKPIIGQGVYGIVLKPDIIHGNNNYVSKLFILPENVSITEFKKLETSLNKIDPLNSYHLPMIDIDIIKESHNLDQLNSDDKKRYVYIATYEYGGISLNNLIEKSIYDYLITPAFCKQILNGFINLFEGLIHLSIYKINHNDIHPGNIVIDLDDPSMMRFIDFDPDISWWNFEKRYALDITNLIHGLESNIHKFIIYFTRNNNLLFSSYLQDIIVILDKSREELARSEDIKLIPKIKNTLKKKFYEIELFY
jgi:serine/threonine protein kinase